MGKRSRHVLVGIAGVVAVLTASGCGAGGERTLAGGLVEAGSTSAAGSEPRGAAVAPPAAATDVAAIELTGEAVVPGPGDPEAVGAATIDLVAERREICVDLDVAGLDRPTAVHLHESPAGSTGDVVLALPAPDAGDGRVSACVSAAADLFERLQGDPAGFYVNVHTDAYPGGALRGQLR